MQLNLQSFCFFIVLICFSKQIEAQIYLPIPKEEAKVYTTVDQMPCFRSCTNSKNKNIKAQCCAEEVKTFMLEHLKYPVNAKNANLEGKVIVQFIVAPNGDVTNPKIISDIGMGCGEEALRVVRLMPKWEEPGIQNNQYVPVQFNLPVVFNMDEIGHDNPNATAATPEEAAKVIGAFFYIAKKMMENSKKNK